MKGACPKANPPCCIKTVFPGKTGMFWTVGSRRPRMADAVGEVTTPRAAGSVVKVEPPYVLLWKAPPRLMVFNATTGEWMPAKRFWNAGMITTEELCAKAPAVVIAHKAPVSKVVFFIS